MTVGESLTEARYQAGLSVDELSERTRIRDSVIRSIERDDYEACGGDLFVRGYVRAIAGAVGIDAQPLIQEFDQERAHATSLDLSPAPAAGGGQDPDETRFDLPAVPEDPTATRFDLPPVRADHTEDMMAAGYELQPGAATAATSAPPDGWATPVARAEVPAASPRTSRTSRTSRNRRDRRRLLIGVAAVALLVIVAVVGVHLASGTTSSKNVADSSSARAAASSAAAAKSAAAKSAAAVKSAAAKAKHAAAPKPVAKPTKPAPAPRPHASQPVTLLSVAAAYAYGPGGVGDGDNPSGAEYTIARNPPLPWSTNWYATPQFGLLKHGTGLLLSLGHKDTITSVLIDLTQYRGVDLQLQVGEGMEPQDFKVAASADNTGGTVRLTLRHPASARYLLIWFTQLPPNGDGQYQESIYHVLVNGRR